MKDKRQNLWLFMAKNAWSYAADERWRMVLFYGLLMFANCFMLLQPVVLERVINTVQAGGPNLINNAIFWCSMYASTILGFWMLHGPARIIERRLAFNIYYRFVNDLYRKVTEMPLRWHQDHHSGNTINRVTKAGKALFQFAQDQFILVQLAVRFIGCLLFLAWYSWWVAIVVAVFCACIFFSMTRFDMRLRPLVNTTNEREHHLTAALYDYIGNIITVLTLRLQGHTQKEIRDRFVSMREPFWKAVTLNECKWFVINVALTVMQAGIVGAYIVVTLWQGREVQIGIVVAIFQYQIFINQVFFLGAMAYNDLLTRYMDINSVEELIESHSVMAVEPEQEYSSDWQNIEVKHLTFTHSEGEDALAHLQDINLSIKANMKIALVGTSGSGKTTLLTLLRGAHNPQSVALSVDNRFFEDLKPLSKFTTLIPQDAEVFENTVLYNLTLGMDVPDEVVRQALYISTFDEVAAKLDHGIQTDIRERGVNLSGGQKQRLALARGLIAARESSLILFDEPTSSVDMATESAIFDRLFGLYYNKAIIASVHRLYLLPRFDWVCLMQEGAIIQQGTFRSLIAKPGLMQELWQSQFVEE